MNQDNSVITGFSVKIYVRFSNSGRTAKSTHREPCSAGPGPRDRHGMSLTTCDENRLRQRYTPGIQPGERRGQQGLDYVALESDAVDDIPMDGHRTVG